MENESVNQWVDVAGVRALAEGLMKPAATPPAEAPEGIYGSGFVGFAESGQVETAPVVEKPVIQAPVVQSAPAPVASPPTVSTPAPTPAAKVPTSAPIPIAPRVPGPTSPAPVVQTPVVPAVQTPVVQSPVVPVVQPPVPVEPVRSKFPVVTSPVVTPTVVAPKEISVAKPAVPEPVEEVVKEVRKEPIESVEVTLTPTVKNEVPSTKPVARYPSPFKIASAPIKPPAPLESAAPVSGKGQPLSKRLSTFGTWLKAEIPAESYFICDRNGEVLVDEIGSSKLIKVARTLAHASTSAGRQVGSDGELSSLHVKIATDRVLEVIPRSSHFGLVILGVIVPRPLSKEVVASIANSLDGALE